MMSFEIHGKSYYYSDRKRPGEISLLGRFREKNIYPSFFPSQ